MTDGIIQKVFWKYKIGDNYKTLENEYNNALGNKHILIIDRIEQELIKKIENLDKEYYEDKDGKWTYEDEEKRARLRIIRELIGETKE